MNKINTVEELLEALDRSEAEYPNLTLSAHLIQISIETGTRVEDMTRLLVEKAKENRA
jgi:hypothetical protein